MPAARSLIPKRFLSPLSSYVIDSVVDSLVPDAPLLLCDLSRFLLCHRRDLGSLSPFFLEMARAQPVSCALSSILPVYDLWPALFRGFDLFGLRWFGLDTPCHTRPPEKMRDRSGLAPNQVRLAGVLPGTGSLEPDFYSCSGSLRLSAPLLPAAARYVSFGFAQG